MRKLQDVYFVAQHLTPDEVQTLGTYNAERHRGIVHTAEWQAKMAELQEKFDDDQSARDEFHDWLAREQTEAWDREARPKRWWRR